MAQQDPETSQTFDPGPAAGVRWDLADLYAEGDGLEQDLDRALSEARSFAERHRGRVAELDAAALAAAVAELEAMEEPVERAQSFAGLRFAGDTSEPSHGALLQRVQERTTEIKNEILFFGLEWAALDEATAAARLEDPVLRARVHFLRSLRRYRPHLLSEPEERLLEETANTGRRAFSRLFDELTSAMRFRLDVDGSTSEVGEEEVLSRLYEPDRQARRAAAAALTEGLKKNGRLLTFVFNTLTQPTPWTRGISPTRSTAPPWAP
jgi:oligoendopeptidase F